MNDQETGEELSPASYREILRHEIEEGLSQLDRPSAGLFLSGLSAGLDIGFGPLLMAVVLTTLAGDLPSGVVDVLVANAYAVGFIFVVIGRSELFTEHTTLAVVPVLNRRASVANLLRLWGVIYLANIVGAVVFALLGVEVGLLLETVDPAAFGELAGGLVGYSRSGLVLSGVLAGWLMGLMSWLVAAGRDTISEALFIWLIATAIGLAHLPHCIAGSVEVLFGVFAETGVTLLDYGHFLLWSTLGNVVGGTVFVALLKYGHGVRGGRSADELDVDIDDPEAGDRT